VDAAYAVPADNVGPNLSANEFFWDMQEQRGLSERPGTVFGKEGRISKGNK